MAERHDLVITISETGEVTIQAEGINGPKCIKETDFLIENGDEILSQEFTSEYYKQEEDEGTVVEQND